MDKRWEFFRSNLLKMADNISFSIDEHNENMIKIKYVWRSFLEIFKKYGLEEFVPQYCNTDYDTCQKIHPGIKMTRTRTLVESEFCDHCREYAPK